MASKSTQSTNKRTAKRPAAGSRSGGTTAPKRRAASGTGRASSNGNGSRSPKAVRSQGTSRSAAASRASRSSANKASTNSKASTNGTGLTETIKDAASKARGPAVTVGAAAAGLAGGLILRGRSRRRTVLGLAVPKGLGSALPDLDVKSVAKSMGHASKQFAKSSKSVSKDLERAGDQAERIGKILG